MELSDRPLEAELAEIAERAEPGRTAQLAVRHWGWDGRGGATLEVTGRELGDITRERVRQLCDRLAQRLRREQAPAPALERALVLAAHAAPTTAHDLARRLADEHIAAQPFDPAGLLTAAAVLGREPTFSLETVKDVARGPARPAGPGERHDRRHRRRRRHRPRRRAPGGRGPRRRSHGPRRRRPRRVGRRRARHGGRLRARRLRLARAAHRLVLPAVGRQERRGVARRQGAQHHRRGPAPRPARRHPPRRAHARVRDARVHPRGALRAAPRRERRRRPRRGGAPAAAGGRPRDHGAHPAARAHARPAARPSGTSSSAPAWPPA